MEERYDALITKFRELIAKYGEDGKLDEIEMELGEVCVIKIYDDGSTILFNNAVNDGFDAILTIDTIECFDIDELEMFYNELATRLEATAENYGEYFSEDLYSLIMGNLSAEKFRKRWGCVDYDAMNEIINVGENTILTNMG